MDSETTTEQGNKLIAEFDGWECDNSQPHTDYLKIPLSKEGGKAEIGKIFWGTFYKDDKKPTSILNLKYHTSWDWLMPVVEKIAAMDYMNFNLSSFDGAGFYDDDYKHTARGTRIFSKKDKLIDSTWQAVTQFIQCYNQKQSQ